MRRGRATAIGLLLVVGSATVAVAQPFRTLTVGLAGMTSVGRDAMLWRNWQPTPGAALTVATPFYVGTMAAHITYQTYGGGDPQHPDYGALLVSLGWGPTVPLPARFQAGPQIFVGNYQMVFDDEVIDDGLRSENELALGVGLQLARPVTRRLAASVGASAMQIYTHRPIRLAHLTAGVHLTLDTPGWLQRALR